MKSPLVGSWQSARSTIPDYQPGGEWLHFSPEGEHVWEVAQPGGKGRSSVNQVLLKKEKEGYSLLLVKESTETGWLARIDHNEMDELQVAPKHGFVTTFRRMKPPSQSPDTSPC